MQPIEEEQSVLVRTILIYGDDALRRKSRPVTSVTPELRELAQDMLETMRAANGVGLAAEQVGEDAALCVIDVPRDAERPDCVEANAGIPMPLIMLNPQISAHEGQQRGEEGCLSFPDISAPVTRAMEVTASYNDLDGAAQTVTARGLLARAIQHEMDHLNGVLLVDRMSPLQRLSMAGQLKRLQQPAAGKHGAK